MQSIAAEMNLSETAFLHPQKDGYRSEYDQIVAVTDEPALRGLRPDFKQLAAIDCRGVIVTVPSESDEFDFVSRYFAPAAGVDEDPVTGSAHCCLGPY